MTSVGIERMGLYAGAAFVDVAKLAQARGLDPARFANLLMRQGLPGPVPAMLDEPAAARRDRRGTAWGDVLAVPQPGAIGGRSPVLAGQAADQIRRLLGDEHSSGNRHRFRRIPTPSGCS